jgi:hypothetical protein
MFIGLIDQDREAGDMLAPIIGGDVKRWKAVIPGASCWFYVHIYPAVRDNPHV